MALVSSYPWIIRERMPLLLGAFLCYDSSVTEFSSSASPPALRRISSSDSEVEDPGERMLYDRYPSRGILNNL